MSRFSFSCAPGNEAHLHAVSEHALRFLVSRFWSWALSPWQPSSFLLSHLSGYISVKVQHKSLFYGYSLSIPPGRHVLLLCPIEPWTLPGLSAHSLLVFRYWIQGSSIIIRTLEGRTHVWVTSVTFGVPRTLEMPPNGHEWVWKGFLFTLGWR